MYNATIRNKFTGKNSQALFVALNQAQRWVNIMADEYGKEYGKPERVIVKGSEPYDTSLVLSEKQVTLPDNGEDVVHIYVHLSAEYETNIEELDVAQGKSKQETEIRLDKARKISMSSKVARDEGMLVLDYFIHLISKRAYSIEDKIKIQGTPKIQLALSFLSTGNLAACRNLLKEMKASTLIKKTDLNKTIKLINDINRFKE